MKKIPKAYHSKGVESRIYKAWERSGYFNPDNLPKRHKTPFSIVLPPPNVTSSLHMGSALMLVIQDIMIRFERMRGKKTLWLPGTDHASIATETKFLKDRKISRNDYADKREEFITMVKGFALQNQNVIIKQMHAMGSSLDWSRLRYTLDDERAEAVRIAFKKMYDAGLIEQDTRVINWDHKGQTTVSDDEIEYETRTGLLYTFRYAKEFPIPIATTRPETKVGDTAVAVNPDDTRYKQYVGKEYTIEFAGTNLKIKIISDNAVDPEFGTGAVGITPDHSIIDDEIAKRHNLERKQVINELDRMNDAAGIVNGLKTTEARERVVEWLRENKLLEKEPEEIEQRIAKAQRSGGRIENLPKRHQWFVKVAKPIRERGNKTLKELMREPVADGRIKILPERFVKIYFHWIDNLRDWNISRQIWFGHRIPIWHCPNTACVHNHDHKDYKPLVRIENHIKECPRCHTGGVSQEFDTLDTWFSSGLWTFSTLGWPNETSDLKTFHPTDVLETAYDILFFWVARMILMSQFLLGDIPFKTVYLHGLVRDEKNRKISKSLGTNIDPLDMIAQYGADAVRMAMIMGTSIGRDSKISHDKFRAYKHFVNKLWNINRFVVMTLPDKTPIWDTTKLMKVTLTQEDKKLLDELRLLSEEVTQDMDNFKFYLAGEKIYHYVWHTFADKIVEESKTRLTSNDRAVVLSTQRTLLEILTTCLKLLHPFIPFVTEELYDKLPIKNKTLLLVEEWPHSSLA